MAIELRLGCLMKAVLSDIDSAIEMGWTVSTWNFLGFPAFVEQRCSTVDTTRKILAKLGAVELIKELSGLAGEEEVVWRE